MRKLDIERLKYLKNFYYEYPLFIRSKEHEYEMVRLKNLGKIHKLKQENKMLSVMRKSIHRKLRICNIEDNLTDYNMVCLLGNLNSYSEKIGKNSAKIQRLRTQYQQLKPKSV